MPANRSHSIKDAKEAIRKKLAREKFNTGDLNYDSSRVVENDRWWYIPFCWIGCSGFIVNKCDLHVNWLGSALSLDQCFWGHDQGVYCEPVDFTFDVKTDPELAKRLLAKFKHTHPINGIAPHQPVWYRAENISSEFSRQFPTFRRHFVWQAIPDLRHAHENEGLHFGCCLARGN